MRCSCRHGLPVMVGVRAKHCLMVSSANLYSYMVAACKRVTTSAITVASSAPASPEETCGMTRRSGNFPPTVWDYNTILSSTNGLPVVATGNEEHDSLKREIKRLLKVTATPLERLELVHSIQQFGIRYHFEEEVQELLGSIWIEANNVFSNADMHITSMLFKVLRENGYQVTQDVFKRFLCPKVGSGHYSEDHKHDINGILSLYEASFLGFEGEEILDMARLFSSMHLKNHLESKMMEPTLKQQVRYALNIPTHWRLERVQAQWSISFNDGTTNMNPIVHQFAKLDYNMLQELHNREIGEIIRWWNNLSIRDELKFPRDRIVESYIWTMGAIFQPNYGGCRKYLTQALILLTVIDDMFDVYGSINELELFIEVIEKWDVNGIEKLPRYMRICFYALFNTVNESAMHILKEKDIIVAPHIQKLWNNLCKAYFIERTWYHNGHKPSLKEYLRNGTMSSGAQLALSYAVIFSSENVSMEYVDLLETSPDLINWTGKIFRLNNDISTSSNELKRGDVVKAVECCQYEENISMKEAQLRIQSIIIDTWKKINKERFSTTIQKDIVDRCIQICRASHSFYGKGDGYGSPAKDIVISLLFDSS